MIAEDESRLRERRRNLLRALGEEAGGDEWFAERRSRWILGTPEEARETVARFGEAGIERLMLQDFLPWDLDMVDLFGAELVER